MVRHVDTGGIVDRIGVNAPALQRIGNAAALRDPEIGALSDDLGAQFLAIDAQRVIGAVADLAVSFVVGFDEGSDAAEKQEIDLGG